MGKGLFHTRRGSKTGLRTLRAGLPKSANLRGVEVSFHLHLDSETVQHVHSDEPLCVEPDVPVRSVIGLMRAKSAGGVLICHEGRLAGIFTERDALRMMAAGADFDVPIKEVMTLGPVTISASCTVGEAIRSMATGGYRRLPIVDEGRVPVAMLKASNILNYLVDHFPEFIYNLPPAPHHTTQEREGA
jgi:CBS domain-containing protein